MSEGHEHGTTTATEDHYPYHESSTRTFNGAELLSMEMSHCSVMLYEHLPDGCFLWKLLLFAV
jgi:hypothetical protein